MVNPILVDLPMPIRTPRLLLRNPLPGDGPELNRTISLEELARRTRAAVAQPPLPGPGTVLAPEEVDEVRIVAAWLARHPETPALALDPLPDPGELEAFVAETRGSAGRRVVAPARALAPALAPVADGQPGGKGDHGAQVDGQTHVPVTQVGEHHDAAHGGVRR